MCLGISAVGYHTEHRKRGVWVECGRGGRGQYTLYVLQFTSSYHHHTVTRYIYTHYYELMLIHIHVYCNELVELSRWVVSGE